MRKLKKLTSAGTGIATLVLFTSCYNSVNPTTQNSTGDITTIGDVVSGGGSSAFTISNVTIDATGTGNALLTKIFLNTNTSSIQMRDVCESGSSGSTSLPCNCRFSWTEVNSTQSTSVSIPRVTETPVTNVQPFYVECATPVIYGSEIPAGSIIKINVVPAPTSVSYFEITPYNFTKPKTTSESANFYDSDGNGFMNVHRYTCYEKFQRGMDVNSSTTQVADSSNSGRNKDVALASQFCVAKDDDVPGGARCPGMKPIAYSAQSNYYNFYIEGRVTGGASPSSGRFSCPLVQEALESDGTVGTEEKHYPMDTTFALATQFNTSFTVPVEAPSVLQLQGDPGTQSTKCTVSGTGNNNSGGDDSSTSTRCIGWGKKPNSDGTCPYFRDSNGANRMTYRLRRYFAFYPVNFQSDGTPAPEGRPIDIIYVLDRPVNSGDPLKPYTMYGPKPCNFAYFDQTGTLGIDPAPNDNSVGAVYAATLPYNGGMPTYVATNHTAAATDSDGDADPNDADWNEKNIDGVIFPNQDSKSSAATASDPATRLSCSATLPIVEYDSNTGDPMSISLATTHLTNTSSGAINSTPNKVDVGGGRTISLNKVYVRPQPRWSPHYVEDSTFEACAPLADPFKDPPLHFAKMSDSANGGSIGWCAEVYPSQNPAIHILDQKLKSSLSDPNRYPGFVKPYTSHVVKNTASAVCSATPITTPTGYPASAAAVTATWGLGAQNACASGNDTRAAALHTDTTFIDRRPTGTAICSNRTCDRTIVPTDTTSWAKFPLLAPPADVEAMLRTDKSYGCTLSWDGGHGKAGKYSPSEGCCKAAVVGTQVGLGTGLPQDNTQHAAHLEPDRACQIPNY